MVVKQHHLSRIVGRRGGLRQRVVGALARRLAARRWRFNRVGGRVGRRPSALGAHIVRRQHAYLPRTLPARLARLGITFRSLSESDVLSPNPTADSIEPQLLVEGARRT
jgi:hypothetical protein